MLHWQYSEIVSPISRVCLFNSWNIHSKFLLIDIWLPIKRTSLCKSIDVAKWFKQLWDEKKTGTFEVISHLIIQMLHFVQRVKSALSHFQLHFVFCLSKLCEICKNGASFGANTESSYRRLLSFGHYLAHLMVCNKFNSIQITTYFRKGFKQ